jgi:hypothetical protein
MKLIKNELPEEFSSWEDLLDMVVRHCPGNPLNFLSSEPVLTMDYVRHDPRILTENITVPKEKIVPTVKVRVEIGTSFLLLKVIEEYKQYKAKRLKDIFGD